MGATPHCACTYNVATIVKLYLPIYSDKKFICYTPICYFRFEIKLF